MNEDDIRKLLGMLAGGLAGRKIGRGEAVGGMTGGLAGVAGGLFAATLVNAVERLSQSSQSTSGAKPGTDSELRESLASLRGTINGMVVGSGGVLGLLAGLGLTEQQLFKLLGVQDGSEADALVVERRADVLAAVEYQIGSMYDKMAAQFGPLWNALELDKDKEEQLARIGNAFSRTIDQRV